MKDPGRSPKDFESGYFPPRIVCFEDVVWLQGAGPKRDKGVMGDLNQLCEREHDCTNMLPRAVKISFPYSVDSNHYLHNC